MTDQAYRREMLGHCLKLARADFAVSRRSWELGSVAASWYEKNEPWRLTGLRAKVDSVMEQERSVPRVQR